MRPKGVVPVLTCGHGHRAANTITAAVVARAFEPFVNHLGKPCQLRDLGATLRQVFAVASAD